MDLSPIGEAVLIAREGRRLKAYRDSKGIWTIGVGHTSAAGPPVVRDGLTLTAAACDALFARDVERLVRSVREALPAEPPLPQHAFDALVSLCFNIGPGAFMRSGVLRRLRAGDAAGAAQAILLWNRPPEVIPRRQAEHDQFRAPYETALPRARRGDAHPVPRPASVPSGKPADTPQGPRPSPAAPPTARPNARRRPDPVRPRAAASSPAQVPAQVPASGPMPAPAPRPASVGGLARLWARLRERVRG